VHPFFALLGHVVGASNVCQSVFGNFLHGVAAGEVGVNDPAQLRRLLRTMAVNKLRDLARNKEQAACRDRRVVIAGELGLEYIRQTVAPDSTPSEQVERADLLREIYLELPEWAQPVLDLCILDRSWEEIGSKLGKPPHTIRVRFNR
jgi:DNA-directed RNA polymerase specialized sigma24 family protein